MLPGRCTGCVILSRDAGLLARCLELTGHPGFQEKWKVEHWREGRK